MRLFVFCLLAFGCSTVLAAPPAQLLDPDVQEEVERMLPHTASEEINALLHSDDLIWYTEAEIPRAYQFQSSFHDPKFNIAAPIERDGRPGNGNTEFPWNHAGGCDNVKGLRAYRFVKFPSRLDGSYWPVVVYKSRIDLSGVNQNSVNRSEANGTNSQWQWTFPQGTVFGELLCMPGPNDLVYPFELRLRFRREDYWDVDVYRPFVHATDLAKRVKEIEPEWYNKNDLSNYVMSLEQPSPLNQILIADNNRNTAAFRVRAGVHPLPRIVDTSIVERLLTETPWQTALGATWKTGTNKVVATAPTAAKGTGFNIVPEGYGAHSFVVDTDSCMRCHRHTNVPVRTFEDQRPWYGRIRGSDGIFSFHPISPRSIHPRGINLQVVLREEFVKGGVAAMFDKDVHPVSVYKQMKDKGVRE